MGKEISNTMIEVEEGIELNDKDYTVALTEASNEELFSKYKEMYDKLLNLQRETFEVMFRCGFYKLEEVSPTKVSEKYQILLKEQEKVEGE